VANLLYRDAALIFKTIVGVDISNLSTEDIRKVYIAWIKVHHPDMGGNLNQVQLVNSAWDTLEKGKPVGPHYPHQYDSPPRPEPPPKPVGDLYIWWAWKGIFIGGMSESDLSREFSVLFYKFEKIDSAAIKIILAEFDLKNRASGISELFAGKIGTNVLYNVVHNYKMDMPPYKEYIVTNIENHPTDLILKMHGLAT
jgi:hypothetical protein